jgi:hypothetical protein
VAGFARARKSTTPKRLGVRLYTERAIDSPARTKVFATDLQLRHQSKPMTGEVMSEKKRLNRRSFMTRVVGAAAAIGATAAVTGEAAAQNYTGRTDSDTGSYADRAGYGRTGLTDNDSGNGSDRAGYGRGGGGGGGGTTGLTDSDAGGNADRAGNGRGATRNSPTGLTDGDSGSYADRASYGRGPRRG